MLLRIRHFFLNSHPNKFSCREKKNVIILLSVEGGNWRLWISMNYLKWPIIAMGMWGLVLEILEHAAPSSDHDQNEDARNQFSCCGITDFQSLYCPWMVSWFHMKVSLYGWYWRYNFKWMTNTTIKIQYLNSFSQFRFSRWLGRTEAPQYLIVLTIDMCLNKKNKSSSTLTPYQRSLVFSYIRIYQEIWLIQFKF